MIKLKRMSLFNRYIKKKGLNKLVRYMKIKNL